jgi:uncharacterized membrane-anchored protein YhcB (DUF1043 family)
MTLTFYVEPGVAVAITVGIVVYAVLMRLERRSAAHTHTVSAVGYESHPSSV